MSKIRKRMGLTERSGSILFIEFLPGGNAIAGSAEMDRFYIHEPR